ncbi:MAG: hypothetical protein WBH77_07055 [Saccharofermentanales bacterium]
MGKTIPQFVRIISIIWLCIGIILAIILGNAVGKGFKEFTKELKGEKSYYSTLDKQGEFSWIAAIGTMSMFVPTFLLGICLAQHYEYQELQIEETAKLVDLVKKQQPK